MLLKFFLNKTPVELEVSPNERLIDILRYRLGAVGTKESCGEGQCGACSVIIDNKLVLSCLIPAFKISGKQVETSESLALESGFPNYVQKAFIEADAIQCGFCTSGLLMAVKSYVENKGKQDTESIKKALAGNICRCTGYVNVIEAVKLAFKYYETKQ